MFDFLRRQGRFFYLFLANILLIIAQPIFADFTGVKFVLYALYMLSMVSAIYAVGMSSRKLMISIVLASLAFLSIAIATLTDYSPFSFSFSLLFELVFNVYMIFAMLQGLLRVKDITHDIVYGSMAVYLLIGVTFSILYTIFYLVEPNAFQMNVENFSQESVIWWDFLYYSFVTLTTLGYGDIIPTGQIVRSASILEAITGVLYTSILLARFVSIYINQNFSRDEKD
jgi:Ion channel